MGQDDTRSPLWRVVVSWRAYAMPRPRRAWVVVYPTIVFGLSGLATVINISPLWAFLVGGVCALVVMATLEASYRKRHPLP